MISPTHTLREYVPVLSSTITWLRQAGCPGCYATLQALPSTYERHSNNGMFYLSAQHMVVAARGCHAPGSDGVYAEDAPGCEVSTASHVCGGDAPWHLGQAGIHLQHNTSTQQQTCQWM